MRLALAFLLLLAAPAHADVFVPTAPPPPAVKTGWNVATAERGGHLTDWASPASRS